MDRTKEWVSRNPEKKQKLRRNWRINNQEKVKDQKTAWRENNLDKVKAHKRQSYKRNKSKIDAKNRKWNLDNQEKTRAIKRSWEKRHPEQAAAIKHRTRCQRMAAPGSFTGKDIAKMRVDQGGRCAACPALLADGCHIDHKIPLARGGTNYIENIQLLCPPCNLSKGKKLPEEWRPGGQSALGMLLNGQGGAPQ